MGVSTFILPSALRRLLGQNRGNGANDNGGRVSAPIIMDNALRQSEENHGRSLDGLDCSYRAQRLTAIGENYIQYTPSYSICQYQAILDLILPYNTPSGMGEY